ncbi:MAG: catalase-related domain-containing protein, partial [Paeniglutamicibacter terrestris]
AMQYTFNAPEARVYTPNSFGGPAAQPERAGEGSWETDGELVRAAQTLRSEDDDFGQAGTLYREVFSAESKERFHANLLGQCNGITIDSIREGFFQYWTNVDANLGQILRDGYAAGVAGSTDGASEMAGKA